MESVNASRGRSSSSGRRVKLCDVTLRDGEQACTAAFSLDSKVTMSRTLSELGVDQIQLGMCGRDEHVIASVKDAGVETPLELLGPLNVENWEENIRAAQVSDTDVIRLGMRGRDSLLDLLGLSREDALKRVAEGVSLAKSNGGKEVVFGVSFATQSDGSFLKDLYLCAVEAGADGLEMSDSLGVARPSEIASLVTFMQSLSDIPVGVHCHNDYGLGTACTLAGVEAGASSCDVSLSGLGERAGNTSLEQIAVALQNLYGYEVGVNLELLCTASEQLSGVLNLPIPADKPIIGGNVFAQKLDLHVRLAASHPELFEPFDPTSVGNHRSIKLGNGSGPHAIKWKLQQIGQEASEDEVLSLVNRVNRYAEESNPEVDTREFKLMLSEVRQAT